MTPDTITPMMQQYLRIKKEHEGAIVFFRLGDFYETFLDDAILASKVLEITLTSREAGKGNKVPMAGIPYHAADSYIARLVRTGHKIAICEQMEDPRFAKGIVKREVTRVITPGTALDTALLEAKQNRYLAAVFFQHLAPSTQHPTKIGLAYLDLSTGEFRVFETEETQGFTAQFIRVNPAEVLVSEEISKEPTLVELAQQVSAVITPLPSWAFGRERAYQMLTNYFHVGSLEGFGCEDLTSGLASCGAILHYVQETQSQTAEHIQRLQRYRNEKYMMLDPATQRNLELIRTSRSEDIRGSLLGVLDQTTTAMGGRLLRSWMTQPLLEVEEIQARHDAVEEFARNAALIGHLRPLLGGIADLERLMARLSCGAGNARDLLSLKQSIKQIPTIQAILESVQSPMLIEDRLNLTPQGDLVDLLERSIHEDPPITLRDGRLIKTGYHQELDELRSISQHGKEWLAQLEQQEIQKTGISSLKVRYNQVFGYYIEVTHPNLKYVPSHYIRKQTLSNAERFMTPELKEWEAKILGAQEKILELEYQIFQQIRTQVLTYIGKIQQNAQAIAQLDVLSNLALVAIKNHYVRPQVESGDSIEITEGRHPVLEQLLMGERFVPNDTLLDSGQNQIIIMTGPNMAGKSVYLRQVALIVLMAQMGSFVPAKQAKIGIVDRIFTRVGAQDELSRGQSTFMVEMNETANILNNATARSLILLDEIGRGTSTFDGISIAWAVTEYLHEQLRAKTLFATHYHELTELELAYPRIKNYHVEVKEWNDQIIFLRKIIPGGTDKSYGIHVGRLAGLPSEVIQRAKKILTELEQATLTPEGKPKLTAKSLSGEKTTAETQLSFFTPQNLSIHPVVEELKQVEVEKMTPLEALNFLSQLKGKVEVDPC